MSWYSEPAQCEFPECAKPAPATRASGRGVALCFEHDALLFYDAREFHRIWDRHREPCSCPEPDLAS
jgi:hypothetical protein